MKILFFIGLISFSAQAIELKFIGPCEESFIMRTEVTEDFQNVGELTIATLSKFGIPFRGTPEGLSSVFETPVGKEAIEIISDEEKRAYGWCFSVDGVSPELYPHEVFITPDTKSIVWHFGFARFYKGEWVTQCTPSHTVRPDFLCSAGQ